jgi:transcriptional regulator with XRE-family HTH domain
MKPATLPLSRGARLLVDYMDRHDITLAEFGTRIGAAGVSDVTVHRWVRGKSPPSVENAQAIERATDGAVPWTAFFTDEERQECPCTTPAAA